MTRWRLSSAAPLALACTLLVVYASLYPFADWRWPPGQPLEALALLPWPRPWLPFDLWSNTLGYLPLGALLTIAARRSGLGLSGALALGVVAPTLLSYAMELTQQFLPSRHVSAKDWLMNGVGALLGTLMAWAWLASGGVQRWQRWRARWFGADSGLALALLALWPLALLVPSAVPLGLGDVGSELRELGLALVQDVPWAEPVRELLAGAAAAEGAAATHAAASTPRGALPLVHLVVVALGLLAPCAVMCSVVQHAVQRIVLVLGASALALGVLSLATLLSFGPQHALAWMTTPTLLGLGLGLLLALALAPWPARGAAAIGLVVLGVLVGMVAQLPSDPYLAQTQQAWEQGRFIRFHGVTQWLAWLWPYLALAWLLARLTRAKT
jgi:VanZ family protein